MEGKLDSVHWTAAVLDHGQLDDNCCDQDDQEQRIVEEVLEDVGFSGFQFSGVDLVENLQ